MSEDKSDELVFLEVSDTKLDLANEEDRLIDKFMRSIQPQLMSLGESGMLSVDKESRKVVATAIESGKSLSWNLDVELDKIRDSEKVVH